MITPCMSKIDNDNHILNYAMSAFALLVGTPQVYMKINQVGTTKSRHRTKYNINNTTL